jgi:16S rRNA C967 or C1407 C5-methylase (RsmB/RsmF family)
MLVGQDGFFRTFPPEQETDGFFAAVLERTLNGSRDAC